MTRRLAQVALAFAVVAAAPLLLPRRERPGLPLPPPPRPEPPAAPGRGPRLARLARPAGLATGWMVAAALATLLVALLASFALGYRSMTVMSGSMEPAIRPGDVVVNRRIQPLEARVGDVITFREPGSRRFITHRVRRITARGSRVTFVTKGDANTGTERWSVPASGEIGRVRFRLPGVGYALFWTHGRYAILALITIPALLLGAITVARIWRPPGKEPHAGAA